MKNFIISFGGMILAEIGDKSNLLVLSLVFRSRLSYVITATFLTSLILNSVAVFIGGTLNYLLPHKIIQIISIALFILLGFWILLKQEKEEKRNAKFLGFWSVFLLYTLSELGDKTQIFVVSFSAYTDDLIPIALGAIFGMWIVSITTAFLAEGLSRIIKSHILRIISGVIFIATGLLLFIFSFLKNIS